MKPSWSWKWLDCISTQNGQSFFGLFLLGSQIIAAILLLFIRGYSFEFMAKNLADGTYVHVCEKKAWSAMWDLSWRLPWEEAAGTDEGIPSIDICELLSAQGFNWTFTTQLAVMSTAFPMRSISFEKDRAASGTILFSGGWCRFNSSIVLLTMVACSLFRRIWASAWMSRLQ